MGNEALDLPVWNWWKRDANRRESSAYLYRMQMGEKRRKQKSSQLQER